MSAQPLRAFAPDLAPADPIPSGIPTVRQIVAMHLADLQLRVTTEHFEGVARHVSQFSAWFGDNLAPATRRQDLLLEDNPDWPICRQQNVTEWIARNPGWEAVATKKRAIIDLLACFNWAKEEGLILASPYRRPRWLKDQADIPRRPAEQHEYVTLMRHGSRAIRRVLYFLRRTGARTKEVRELLLTDLRLNCESPHCVTRNKTFAKTGEPRLIALDPAAARFLGNLVRQAAPGQTRVFVNTDGKPWKRRTMCQHLRRLAERIGLDDDVDQRVTAYCLRHKFTVDGIDAGESNRQIADALGQAGTHLVDNTYGRKSRQRVKHLGGVTTRIARRGKKPASVSEVDQLKARIAQLESDLLKPK